MQEGGRGEASVQKSKAMIAMKCPEDGLDWFPTYVGQQWSLRSVASLAHTDRLTLMRVCHQGALGA